MNLYLYLVVVRFAIVWVRVQAGPALVRPPRRRAND
jgi:hypothetical protein